MLMPTGHRTMPGRRVGLATKVSAPQGRGFDAKARLHLVIPTLKGAGCERAIASILPILARTFSVTLVLHREEIGYHVPSDVRVEVLHVPSKGGGLRRLFEMRSVHAALRRHLTTSCPDVIMSCLDLNNVVTVMARDRICPSIPIVCVEQTVDSRWAAQTLRSRYHRALWPPLLRHAYGRSTSLIVLTHAMAEHLDGWGVRARVRVIPNPVDIEAFRPCRPSEAPPAYLDRRFTAAPIRVLSVGRLAPQKNPLLLLDVMERVHDELPQAQLFVLGEGTLETELRGSIAARGLTDRVHLLGWSDDVAAYMRHADVALHTARYESFGNVCFEALASATPTVATDCSDAFREFLESDVPLFVRPQGDASGLAHAVLRALSLRQAERERGRALVGRLLDLDLIGGSYVEALNSALSAELETLAC